MDRFDPIAWCYDRLPVPTHAGPVRAALAPVKGRVLDIGGGTGKYTARFLGPQHRGIVLDASPKMVRRARRIRRLPALLCDAAALPFADGSIDAVVSTEAFHHFGTAQEAALDEMRRVLRPKGVAVIEEPDPGRLGGRWMARLERLVGMGSVFLPPAELAALLAERFEQVDQTRSGRSTILSRAARPRP